VQSSRLSTTARLQLWTELVDENLQRALSSSGFIYHMAPQWYWRAQDSTEWTVVEPSLAQILETAVFTPQTQPMTLTFKSSTAANTPISLMIDLVKSMVQNWATGKIFQLDRRQIVTLLPARIQRSSTQDSLFSAVSFAI